MPSSSFALYALPSDDIVTTATLTFSGSIHPTKGVERVRDGDPGSAMIVNAATGRLIIDQGAAGVVRGVALINTKLTGATIALEGNATDSWGAPSFSTAITAGVAWPDGFEVSPYKDLNTLAPNYRFFSINVTGAPNPHGIGEVLLVRNLRNWPAEISPGTDEAFQTAELHADTDVLVTMRHDRQANRRVWRVNMLMRETQLTELLVLKRAAGIQGFLFIRDKTKPEALYVMFQQGQEIKNVRNSRDLYAVTITLQELSFGKKIP